MSSILSFIGLIIWFEVKEERLARFEYEHDKWLEQNGGTFHYA